jgi:S-DNA-T family DNA segregation ATPase FtsK/SpoIIIE
MPALIIIIDEYAELKDEAPDAMRYADSVARLGRAVAVTLIAATQRPTQKAMGEGAVRSQMDLRICFRVREPRDVDLILGQGMLRSGWDAHKLNAPGKFLVSAPEHDSSKRARCYQVSDQDVTATAAHYARYRPDLDEISRRALAPPENPPRPDTEYDPPSIPDDDDAHRDSGDALWAALCQAPDEEPIYAT